MLGHCPKPFQGLCPWNPPGLLALDLGRVADPAPFADVRECLCFLIIPHQTGVCKSYLFCFHGNPCFSCWFIVLCKTVLDTGQNQRILKGELKTFRKKKSANLGRGFGGTPFFARKGVLPTGCRGGTPAGRFGGQSPPTHIKPRHLAVSGRLV